jgi:hypothetical protein
VTKEQIAVGAEKTPNTPTARFHARTAGMVVVYMESTMTVRLIRPTDPASATLLFQQVGVLFGGDPIAVLAIGV